jgi:predicted RNA-binding protein
MGPALIGVICGDMVVVVHGSEAACVTGARRSGQPLSDAFLDVLAQLGVDVLPVLEHVL